jgi:chorismate dehydratase
MKKLIVARMPYLNSDVFYWTMPPESFELRPLAPRAMAWAIENGEIDAGPLPVAEWFRMQDRLVPVGDYCVATGATAVSILFFSRVPAVDLTGRRIAVTEHTSTSVQLLRVLLEERWHVRPERFVLLDEPADALLLIGDVALRNRHGIEGFPYVYDLGAEWYEDTGLPFVFAHWVARRESDPEGVEVLERTLGECLESGMGRVREIAVRNRAGLSPDEAERYVRGFTYRMGAAQVAALDLFRSRLGRLPAWRPAAPGVRSSSGRD